MTDYRKTPKDVPLARHLEPGDLLTEGQANCIQDHVLGRYGRKIVPVGDPWKPNPTYRVERDPRSGVF